MHSENGKKKLEALPDHHQTFFSTVIDRLLQMAGPGSWGFFCQGDQV